MLTREEIIKEVQEWAKENGGITPSEKIIREELKIPKWEWITYWTKITDFQHEAGLAPQKFDKTKYNKNNLCDEFIKLIREKNKWPTRDELDYKRRQDSTFPASVTFYKQLGLTVDLALTILEYIKDKRGYEDVVNICDSVIQKYKNDNKTEIKDAEQADHGWVYLFKHGHFNQYRIGKTTDLLRRGGEIRIQLPERAILIHSIETADITGVETYWLNRFKSKQMNGDWFNLGRADVKEFKSWKRIF